MKTTIATRGDTWDSIAYKVYGDEFKCDTLRKANDDTYSEIVVFEGGETINVPEIATSQLRAIKAPWES